MHACVYVYACVCVRVCICLYYSLLSLTVHELKMVLPLKREKGHHKCGEVEIELNDLHMQLPTSAPATDEQDNRTAVTANAATTATQNGPTSNTANSAAVAGGVAALTNDFNLMQLDSPATDRRAESQSPSGATPTTTPSSTATTGATSAQNTATGTERQTGLAVPGAATVAAVGGAAAVATATSGNTRVPTPTSPAPANTPAQV